ncbi:MAG: serine/threonine protein kinase [Bacteroidetes bacterium]|nr:serine/threonine protein kinase [Bacteroidota bacterium]
MLIAFSLLSVSQLCGQSRGIENIGIGTITIIEMGNNGDIWAGSKSQGVGFYNGTTQVWTYFNTGNSSKILSDSVTSLTFGLVNGVQHAYIGTTSGLVDIKAGVVDTIPLPYTRRVSGVSLVNSDTLWVSSDSGVVAIDTAGQVIFALTTVDSSIPSDHLSTSQRGGQNCAGIAVGTPNSGVYYTKDYVNFVTIDTSGPNFRLVDNRVNTIYKENQCNRYLVGTKGGFSMCPEGVPCQNFTTANGLPQNDVTTIGVGCNGVIWIGMRDSGVAVFNNPTFTRITGADGLSDMHVTSISFTGGNCTAHVATGDGNIAVVDSGRHVVQVLNGVADVSANVQTVSVYPQPASNEVNFVFGQQVESGGLMLTDLSGRMVQDLSVKGATNIIANVSSLPQGLYFYRLTSDGQMVKTGKVQVMR